MQRNTARDSVRRRTFPIAAHRRSLERSHVRANFLEPYVVRAFDKGLRRQILSLRHHHEGLDVIHSVMVRHLHLPHPRVSAPNLDDGGKGLTVHHLNMLLEREEQRVHMREKDGENENEERERETKEWCERGRGVSGGATNYPRVRVLHAAATPKDDALKRRSLGAPPETDRLQARD